MLHWKRQQFDVRAEGPLSGMSNNKCEGFDCHSCTDVPLYNVGVFSCPLDEVGPQI